MPKSKTIRLSPSKLNAFKECPRCFWLSMNGKRMPSGIFPSLPGGIDLICKDYFDKYRNKLPPILKGKIPGVLVDKETADYVRKKLKYEDEALGATLKGLMDDCFVAKDGTLIVMDNKSRGFPVKEIYDFYAFQLDAYAFLLKKAGHKVAPYGYLVYYVANREGGVKGAKFDVNFKIDVRKVKLQPGRVMTVFKDAIKLAKQKKAPSHHKDCGMCMWTKELGEM